MKTERRAKALTSEDARLWRRVTGDVERLEGRDYDPSFEDLPSPSREQAAIPGREPPSPPSPPPPPGISRTTVLKPLTHGGGPGLDRRTQTRMRRGKVEIEGRIDLHGLSLTEAERALDAFLRSSFRRGRRAVLVITGKGARLDGRIGAIRQAAPGWLNGPGLRQFVRGFSHAVPKDGGEGALYVLLKRRKHGD